MPRKTTKVVEQVIDQSLVANTVAQFLEVFKNNAVEKLMSSGLSKDDLSSINKTLNSELEATRSKAFEYVSKL